jgi:2-keto-4-pentenoate hydratase/2-oxohepta-3-ene-1,7-dioic acid hydratase in catechol pathway
VRLLVFSSPSGPRTGVLTDEGVLDVTELLGFDEPVRDVQDLIARANPVLDRIGERLAAAPGVRPVPLSDLTLLPPVLQPPSVRDHIGYEEHATRNHTRKIADVWYRRPVHYYSNPSRLVGTGAPVAIPATERLDYELEIAAVIGTEGRDIPAADAMRYVFGFTILNDWSARDLQADEMAYGLGPAKGKDFATSLGPWVVTTDELLPRLTDGRLDARCQVRVNGETWADSNAKGHEHSWGAMIEHIAQDSRVLPGDVIAAGTVGRCSIGEALRLGLPAHYLVPGDRVELEVDGIGTLANTIAANPRSGPARYQAAELPPMPVPSDSAPATAGRQA